MMLDLPSVTLLIADPRPANRDRIKALLEYQQSLARFGGVVHVDDFADGKESYDRLMSIELIQHFSTNHVLVIQLDGYMTNPEAWSDEFLWWDYIGAPWPAWLNRNRVGNGGFSLRSRRLHEFLATQRWEWFPDDVFISSACGRLIVEAGVQFAPLEVAAQFSRELPIEETHLVPPVTLGFHGGKSFQG